MRCQHPSDSRRACRFQHLRRSRTARRARHGATRSTYGASSVVVGLEPNRSRACGNDEPRLLGTDLPGVARAETDQRALRVHRLPSGRAVVDVDAAMDQRAGRPAVIHVAVHDEESRAGSRDRHRQERRVRAAQRNRRLGARRCRADERRGSKAVERVGVGVGRAGGARCASRAGGTSGTGSARGTSGARRARSASCTAVALQRSDGLLVQILLLQRSVDDLGRADAVLRGERDGCVTASLLAPRTAQRSEMMVAGDGRRLNAMQEVLLLEMAGPTRAGGWKHIDPRSSIGRGQAPKGLFQGSGEAIEPEVDDLVGRRQRETSPPSTRGAEPLAGSDDEAVLLEQARRR